MLEELSFKSIKERIFRKKEMNSFYRHLPELLPYMDDESEKKIDFIKSFLRKELRVEDIENSYISLKKTRANRILYLLFCFLDDYDTYCMKSERNFQGSLDSLKYNNHKNEITEGKMEKLDRSDPDFFKKWKSHSANMDK